MATSISDFLGNTDIYLIDQIMKGRYHKDEKILDAGCGSGRNLHWFVANDYDVYASDLKESALREVRQKYPALPPEKIHLAAVDKLPFADHFFDHIICSAVLHFAADEDYFKRSMAELLRVLQPGGTFWFRMASDIGIEDKVIDKGNGNYLLPDGSTRFLLTRRLLADCLRTFPVEAIEPFKTVNVADARCMSTVVWQKKK